MPRIRRDVYHVFRNVRWGRYFVWMDHRGLLLAAAIFAAAVRAPRSKSIDGGVSCPVLHISASGESGNMCSMSARVSCLSCGGGELSRALETASLGEKRSMGKTRPEVPALSLTPPG